MNIFLIFLIVASSEFLGINNTEITLYGDEINFPECDLGEIDLTSSEDESSQTVDSSGDTSSITTSNTPSSSDRSDTNNDAANRRDTNSIETEILTQANSNQPNEGDRVLKQSVPEIQVPPNTSGSRDQTETDNVSKVKTDENSVNPQEKKEILDDSENPVEVTNKDAPGTEQNTPLKNGNEIVADLNANGAEITKVTDKGAPNEPRISENTDSATQKTLEGDGGAKNIVNPPQTLNPSPTETVGSNPSENGRNVEIRDSGDSQVVPEGTSGTGQAGVENQANTLAKQNSLTENTHDIPNKDVTKSENGAEGKEKNTEVSQKTIDGQGIANLNQGGEGKLKDERTRENTEAELQPTKDSIVSKSDITSPDSSNSLSNNMDQPETIPGPIEGSKTVELSPNIESSPDQALKPASPEPIRDAKGEGETRTDTDSKESSLDEANRGVKQSSQSQDGAQAIEVRPTAGEPSQTNSQANIQTDVGTGAGKDSTGDISPQPSATVESVENSEKTGKVVLGEKGMINSEEPLDDKNLQIKGGESSSPQTLPAPPLTVDNSIQTGESREPALAATGPSNSDSPIITNIDTVLFCSSENGVYKLGSDKEPEFQSLTIKSDKKHITKQIGCKSVTNSGVFYKFGGEFKNLLYKNQESHTNILTSEKSSDCLKMYHVNEDLLKTRSLNTNDLICLKKKYVEKFMSEDTSAKKSYEIIGDDVCFFKYKMKSTVTFTAIIGDHPYNVTINGWNSAKAAALITTGTILAVVGAVAILLFLNYGRNKSSYTC